jgi:integrase
MKTTMPLDFKKSKDVAFKKIASGEDIGLFILIALETGLRLNDILTLEKSNFFKRNSEYYITFTAKKTSKKSVRPISNITFTHVMDKPYERIFLNVKTNKIYSGMWVGRELKKAFLRDCKQAKIENKTISAHSLRKSAGQRIYNYNGLEAARDFLQHESYQTTRDYLQVSQREMNSNIINTLIN